MKTFNDTKGQTWTVEINVAAGRRCRTLADTNIYGLVENNFAGLAELATDYERLVNVLFALCKEEAESRGVDDEAFAALMGGDALWEGYLAFREELIDFFPDRRRRAALKKVVEKGDALGERVFQLGMEKIDEIDLDSLLSELTTPAAGSPEASESTPGPSPSETSA